LAHVGAKNLEAFEALYRMYQPRLIHAVQRLERLEILGADMGQ